MSTLTLHVHTLKIFHTCIFYSPPFPTRLSFSASNKRRVPGTPPPRTRKTAQNKPFTKLSLTRLNTLQPRFNDMSEVRPESPFLAEMRRLQSQRGELMEICQGGHRAHTEPLLFGPRAGCMSCRRFGRGAKGLA